MSRGGGGAPRRSAVITGGSSGIGLATARALHREGYDLTLVGRRADALAEAADAVRAPGGDAEVAVAVGDLADPEAPARVVDTHAERFGGVDALVAAAGAYQLVRLLELTASAWDATMDVHVRGAVLGAAAAARHMVRAGQGRIVLLSSVNGFHSEPDSIDYSAAKTAVISLARSLAVDLAGTGVTANAVAPGWVSTPMTDSYLDTSTPERLKLLNTVGRPGRVDEIAQVIRFLVVDAPEFLTGSTITVDGGQTALAPLP